MADLVVVADAGVVAGDVQGHGYFGGDEGVGEREQGVKGVARGRRLRLESAGWRVLRPAGRQSRRQRRPLPCRAGCLGWGLGQALGLFLQLAQGLGRGSEPGGSAGAVGLKLLICVAIFCLHQCAGVAEAESGCPG